MLFGNLLTSFLYFFLLLFFWQCVLFWILFTLFSIIAVFFISVFFHNKNRCYLLKCFFFNFKNCLSFLGVFSSSYRDFIFLRFFFCLFLWFWKIALKLLFLKTPLLLSLVFLTTLLLYLRRSLFHFTYGGTFSFTFFFGPSFLSNPGGRRGETLEFLWKR